jgi:hypothetical protein
MVRRCSRNGPRKGRFCCGITERGLFEALRLAAGTAKRLTSMWAWPRDIYFSVLMASAA